jgi:DnaK suppressor protein
MLKESERKAIEGLLLREREQAVRLLEMFEAQKESLQERAGEMSMYRFHMADIGTEAMEQEKEFLLASREGRRLYEIDEALRILYRDPEGFGACEQCGGEIGFDRLEVVPEARRCVQCQSLAEGDVNEDPAAE